jgi:hypothetical protein
LVERIFEIEMIKSMPYFILDLSQISAVLKKNLTGACGEMEAYFEV